MTVYVVQNENNRVEFLSMIEAENYASSNNFPAPIEEQKSITMDYVSYISGIIKQKQLVAPELLIELYATNVLSGITTEQSDALFDSYSDVIIRIKEGSFPTALYRLQQKEPEGFVTQELLDAWITKIQSYI